MRFAVIAMVLLAAVTPAAAGQPMTLFCISLESVPWKARLEPTVPYAVYGLAPDILNAKYCNQIPDQEAVGCSYSLDKGKHFTIVVSSDLPPPDFNCVVEYEKSHLPPNCWGDSFEDPRAMDDMHAYCAAAASSGQ